MSLILVICIKQEKYCDIERAAGAPAKISSTKDRFKRLYLIWLFVLSRKSIVILKGRREPLPKISRIKVGFKRFNYKKDFFFFGTYSIKNTDKLRVGKRSREPCPKN